MSSKITNKLWSNKHTWYIVASLTLGALIVILPVIGGVLGWVSFVIALIAAVAVGAIVWKNESKMSRGGNHGPWGNAADDTKKDLENVQEKLIRSERLAAVGELASGVGHELRNPLNVIRNCAYLLNISLSDEGDEEARNTLEVLDKQIDAANKIVTDLMDFTRITPPSRQRTDINSLVNESLSYVTVPEKVNINAKLNGNSYKINVDPEQIGRVFTNVVTNACQSMNGKGELDIETNAGDSYVRVSFKDSGCGIPEENIDKIFEPLFTTKPKGIGLGLAISKRLVEQNGGKIDVVSKVGKGTTFNIDLPRVIRRKD